VSTTLLPWQNEVAPLAVTSALGVLFTVTLTAGEVETHPFAFVTVTVYDPVELTVMDCVVAPVLHMYEAPAFAVRPTLPPEQNVVAPSGVAEAAGALVIVRVTGVRVLLSQPELVFLLAA
jgi:hypothetical protein